MSLAKLLFCYSLLAVSQMATASDCEFSQIEIQRLREFNRVKQHLKKNVFPTWEADYPNMYFYNDQCQFILNYSGKAPEGFSKSKKDIDLDFLTAKTVYYRPNELTGPIPGVTLSFQPNPTAYTYGTKGSEKWFVMALFPVWKRVFNDHFGFYIGMLAHEMFHPYQFKLPGIKEKMEKLSESLFTDIYSTNTNFKKLVDQELDQLKNAILSSDMSSKKKHLGKFFDIRKERRRKYFIGKLAPLAQHEPLMESVEGVAEYMNLRVMIDAKTFPVNDVLLKSDESFDGYKEYLSYTLKDALENVGSRPSAVQKVGAFQVALLDQLDPNWASKVFETEDFAEGLLRKTLSK